MSTTENTPRSTATAERAHVCPRCGIVAGYIDGMTGKRVCLRHDKPVVLDPPRDK